MTESARKAWSAAEGLAKTLAPLAALAAILLGAYQTVVWVVETRLNSPETISALSEKVRPTAVFTASGSISAEIGTAEYIEDVAVELPAFLTTGVVPDPATGFRGKIALRMKRHLARAPLLTCVTGHNLTYRTSRGPKYDWVYDIRFWGPIEGLDAAEFRVEILP